MEEGRRVDEFQIGRESLGMCLRSQSKAGHLLCGRRNGLMSWSSPGCMLLLLRLQPAGLLGWVLYTIEYVSSDFPMGHIHLSNPPTSSSAATLYHIIWPSETKPSGKKSYVKIPMELFICCISWFRETQTPQLLFLHFSCIPQTWLWVHVPVGNVAFCF